MKEHEASLPGPRPEGQSRDEIAAEIADHLAAAEEELQKHGLAANQAREAARKKFGDVEKIRQTCYWIQNGETIMLRWTLVSLAAVLCILLGLSVLGNWRTQSQLAEQMGKLSEELKAMAAAKQTPPLAPQPPEITGVVYAGSKDKPVAGANLSIMRTDGTVVRRVVTNEQGAYQSGPLETGDYCISAPLQDEPAGYSHWIVQSKPSFIYPGSGRSLLDLDTAFHTGGLKLSVSRTTPEIRREGKYLLTSRIALRAVPTRLRQRYWTSREDSPLAWPVYCYPSAPMMVNGVAVSDSAVYSISGSFKLKNGEEQELPDLYGKKSKVVIPTGKTQISATLYIDVIPLDEKGELVVSQSLLGNGTGTFFGVTQQPGIPDPPATMPASELNEPAGRWKSLTGGRAWLAKLNGYQTAEQLLTWPDPSPLQTIDVIEGQFIKVQAEIPPGVEDEVEKTIASITDVAQLAEKINQGLLRRPVKLKVLGHEPIK